MKKPQFNLSMTQMTKFFMAFIVLQCLIVSNSYAIKIFLNGQPFPFNNTVFNLSESVVYNYNNPFGPIVTNTDQPFLCIGPNLAGIPSATVSFDPSDANKVWGLVGVSSFTYDYTPALLADKFINLQTSSNAQCVVKGFTKVNNPSPGNPFIFADSFETGGSVSTLTFPDLDVTLEDIVNGQTVSNGVDLTYKYRLTNIGDEPLDIDIADYFSQTNNNTAWVCTESMGADMLTTCGTDAIKFSSENYTGAVYLRDAHIENNGESLLITVTRNPSIVADNTPIDLMVSGLVTSAVDTYSLNNSETRAFIGNTNSLPTISTVASQTILEDSAGTGALAFTIADIETPAANLVVTASSSDQSIVSDGNIAIGAGGTNNDKIVVVVPNANANTAAGAVTITLQVTDSGGGMQTSTFDLTITPVNDKPTFNTATIADFPAGTTGLQFISNFIQNIAYGPTTDENSQTITAKNVSNIQDPNGVLSGSPSIGTDLALVLTGQGGTVSFDVTIQDDGLTANGGTDTSDPVSVSFTVLNTLPTISTITNTTVDEDNTTSAIAFTVGDAETAAGSLIMTAMSSDTSVVPISGIQFGGSGASRTVQITPALNQNTDIAMTPVMITLVVDDGSDTAQTTFDLTINPINDAPSFSLSANVLWPAAESGLKLHANYANTFVMGPTSDEVNTQAPLQFNVVVSGDAIFSSSPTIDTSGSLAYVLDGASGVATIQVSLQDDGTTANGGVDTSATQSFTITVQ